jgi:kynureninase
MISYEPTCEFAAAMDAEDPLADFRNRFHIPKAADGSDCVYLSGHSLGLQPKTVRAALEQELAEWERFGVAAHFRARNPWISYAKAVAAQCAALVGAQPDEVAVMNSLTVNLHLMMISFYRPSAGRHRIVMEESAFPSDQYAVKSQMRFHGFDPAESLLTIRDEDELDALLARDGNSVALILLAGVNYSSGRAFDLERVALAGHAAGCAVGFDLAHAAGNVTLRLHDWDADFAVWCTYKYLNAGPGNVAGCFVHARHAHADLPRLAGWWGNDKETRFRMGPDFQPAAGADGWQVSNPSILSLAALRASLDLLDEARLDRLRAKSVRLTGYMEYLLARHTHHGFSIITASDPARRGAQLSISVPGRMRAVCEHLAAEDIVCDWREPDILRAAPAPIYNSFADVHRFAERFVAAVTHP